MIIICVCIKCIGVIRQCIGIPCCDIFRSVRCCFWAHIFVKNRCCICYSESQRVKSDRLNTENNLHTLTSMQQISQLFSLYTPLSRSLLVSQSLSLCSVSFYMHFLTVIWVVTASNPHPLGFRFLSNPSQPYTMECISIFPERLVTVMPLHTVADRARSLLNAWNIRRKS